MRRVQLVLILGIVLLCNSIPAFSQNDKLKELEEQRQRLGQEIEEINKLRVDNKEKELSVLDEVQGLNSQINIRENFVRLTNQQINLLTRDINDNLKKIDKNRTQLKVFKEDYAKMVVKSYKSKSQQSRIMFLLSSADFVQAYKRLQYIKQYNKYRKNQALLIQDATVELQQLNKDLIQQKKNKERLIADNREAQNRLELERKQQEELMKSIRQKEGVYTAQIRQKEQQADAIDKAIERLIKSAIAKANKKAKKAGKKVAKKGSKNTFALTKEAKDLADNFTDNKGRLPWPVESGRIVKKFGEQPHPTLPHIKINSNGIQIETRAGQTVRTVFEGEVMAIHKPKGGSRFVQIRHGNYITTYYNLQNIVVKEGQKVSTKEKLGTVGTSPVTGRATVKFLIYRDTKKLNPQHWIYRK
ncbi:murein hydrolase activator EnvC family protein [Aquimarina rhabdastrellae]